MSAAFLLNRLLNLVFWDFFVKRVAQRTPPRLLVQISNVVVYVLAVAGIIGVVFEKSLTGLLATSGVLGLVLGFALRSIILDLFSGLSINLERPFVIGDFIQVYIRGVPMKFGFVDEVNWRTTKLRTLDNTVEIIPNSVLGAATITNMTFNGPASRFQLTIGFDFQIEPERVLRLINAGLRDATRQKKGPLATPAPKVKTSGLEKGNVQYKMKYFVDTSKCSPGAARAAVLENVFRHVRAAGLKPAYDKSDVYEAPVLPPVLEPAARVKETLRQSAMSRVLSEQDLEIVTSGSNLKSLPPGRTVLAAGEKPEILYVLNEGILDILAEIRDGAEPSRFDSYKTGDLIGAMIGEANSYEVVANTPASVIEIPKEVLDSIPGLEPVIIDTFARQAEAQTKQLLAQQNIEQEQIREQQRQSMIGSIAGRVRGFFKSRMTGHFSSALRSLVGRDPQQRLVNAALASCTLVAAADGRIDEAERDYIIQTLESLDLFQDVAPEEGLKIFETFNQELHDRPEATHKRLIEMIRRCAADDEMEVIILEICKAVSASDGEIDHRENERIEEIAAALREGR